MLKKKSNGDAEAENYNEWGEKRTNNKGSRRQSSA